MKSPVTVVISIIAALMLAALAVYNLTAPPAGSVANPPGTSPSPYETNPGSIAMSLENKVEQLKKELDAAYASGQAKEISFTLTEAEANEAAGRALARSGAEIPMDIKGISVDLQKGNLLQTSIDAVALGINFSVSVKSSVIINNGELSVEVISVDVPMVLTSYKETIAGMVRQKTEELLRELGGGGLGYDGKLDIEFTDIQTQDDSITLKALAKPIG